jgi:hypothetical protein
MSIVKTVRRKRLNENSKVILTCLRLKLKNCVRSAKQKDLELDIDVSFLYDLWIKQEKKCEETGIIMSLDTDPEGNTNPYALSIDRIKNEKGYTKDNVRLVCWWVNNSKNNFSDEVNYSFHKIIVQRREANSGKPIPIVDHNKLAELYNEKKGTLLF